MAEGGRAWNPNSNWLNGARTRPRLWDVNFSYADDSSYLPPPETRGDDHRIQIDRAIFAPRPDMMELLGDAPPPYAVALQQMHHEDLMKKLDTLESNLEKYVDRRIGEMTVNMRQDIDSSQRDTYSALVDSSMQAMNTVQEAVRSGDKTAYKNQVEEISRLMFKLREIAPVVKTLADLYTSELERINKIEESISTMLLRQERVSAEVGSTRGNLADSIAKLSGALKHTLHSLKSKFDDEAVKRKEEVQYQIEDITDDLKALETRLSLIKNSNDQE